MSDIHRLLRSGRGQLYTVVRTLRRRTSVGHQVTGRIPIVIRADERRRPGGREEGNFLKLFNGGRRTPPAAAAAVLCALGHSVVTRRHTRDRHLSRCTSDLTDHGTRLGHRLRALVRRVSRGIRTSLRRHRTRVSTVHRGSFLRMNVVANIVLLLLVVSCVVVRHCTAHVGRCGRGAASLVKRLRGSMGRGRSLVTSHGGTVRAVARRLHAPLATVRKCTRLVRSGRRRGVDNCTSGVLRTSGEVASVLGSLLSFFHLSDNGRRTGIHPFHLRGVTRLLRARFARRTRTGSLGLAVRYPRNVVLGNSGRHVVRVYSGLLNGTIGFAGTKDISLIVDCSNGELALMMRSAKANVDTRRRRQIFKTFRQLSGTTARSNFKLKLDVIGRVIKVLNNAVHLRDRGKRNDHFAIRLPVGATSVNVRRRATTGDLTRVREPCSIVMLSSGPVMLSVAGRVCTNVNIRYSAFAAVNSTVRTVQRRACSLVVASVGVPRVGNCRILRLLHSSDIDGSGRVPVIITATSNDYDRRRLLRGKFATYLFGPFSVSRLITMSSGYLLADASGSRLPSLSSLLTCNSGQTVLSHLVARARGSVRTIQRVVREGSHGTLSR